MLSEFSDLPLHIRYALPSLVRSIYSSIHRIINFSIQDNHATNTIQLDSNGFHDHTTTSTDATPQHPQSMAKGTDKEIHDIVTYPYPRHTSENSTGTNRKKRLDHIANAQLGERGGPR